MYAQPAATFQWKLITHLELLNPNSAAARRRKKKLAENAEKKKDCGK